MHMSATTAGGTATDQDRPAATARLVDGAIDVVRLFTALKNAQGTSARHLLHVLRRTGPQRQSALAGSVHTDPSTVSRQVAELVGDGLVERRADPDDGRASLLALTDEGVAAVESMRRLRDERLGTALQDWSTEEIAAMGHDLERLTSSVSALLAP